MRSLSQRSRRRTPSVTMEDLPALLMSQMGSMLPWDDDSTLGIDTEWVPAVDIHDEGDRFLVRADIPGVDPEEVEVTLDEGVLTIRGERREERDTQEDGFRRRERFSGSFFRRFVLPDSVDAAQVSARSDKGVLEVTIPKTEKSRPKRIKVKG